MELLPGIHCLEQDMAPAVPGTRVILTVVAGERLAMVDTGIPGAAEEVIIPYLKRIGRSPRDIAAIALTHAHADHCGGNHELKRQSGAPIAVHERDVAMLAAPMFWHGLEINGGPADRRLQDGDKIDLGDRVLETIHLPGHTPGTCGFYLRDARVLITGDALQAQGNRPQRLAYYNDPEAYIASVRKVLALPVEHLVLGHAYLPFEKTYLAGTEVRRFLDVSLEFALGLDALILAALRKTREPAAADHLADLVCGRVGESGLGHLAAATVTAHLKRLAARGEVDIDESGARSMWRLV